MQRNDNEIARQRIGQRSAVVIIAIGIVAAIVMRVGRPVLLDQDEGPALAEPTLPDARLDLNTADVAELTLLPGIGPETAKRIVEDRTAIGPFASVEDLQRVPGVGEITIDRIREYVVIDPVVPPDD